MKNSWNLFSSWINARNLGQRAVIFILFGSALIALPYTLLLHPWAVQHTVLSQLTAANGASIQKLQIEINRLQSNPVFDPNRENKARLIALSNQSTLAKTALAEVKRNLVNADQTAAILESILIFPKNIHLVSMTKLPSQSINLAMQSNTVASSPSAPGVKLAMQTATLPESANAIVFKHGIQLKIQGDYFSFEKYLTQLEHLPVRLTWGNVSLTVDDYPKATLTLDLFTLSLDSTWLSI